MNMTVPETKKVSNLKKLIDFHISLFMIPSSSCFLLSFFFFLENIYRKSMPDSVWEGPGWWTLVC